MTAEQEVLVDLLDQLERTARGSLEDRDVLGEPPRTVEAFEAMTPIARTASKALLKSFEQYVDTLHRIVRTQLRATGHRLKGMTPLDVANKAEELDQIGDALTFLDLIKLRNELAHEYPDDAKTRFERFSAAVAGFDFLDDAADRVRKFADHRMPGSPS